MPPKTHSKNPLTKPAVAGNVCNGSAVVRSVFSYLTPLIDQLLHPSIATNSASANQSSVFVCVILNTRTSASNDLRHSATHHAPTATNLSPASPTAAAAPVALRSSQAAGGGGAVSSDDDDNEYQNAGFALQQQQQQKPEAIDNSLNSQNNNPSADARSTSVRVEAEYANGNVLVQQNGRSSASTSSSKEATPVVEGLDQQTPAAARSLYTDTAAAPTEAGSNQAAEPQAVSTASAAAPTELAKTSDAGAAAVAGASIAAVSTAATGKCVTFVL